MPIGGNIIFFPAPTVTVDTFHVCSYVRFPSSITPLNLSRPSLKRKVELRQLVLQRGRPLLQRQLPPPLRVARQALQEQRNPQPQVLLLLQRRQKMLSMLQKQRSSWRSSWQKRYASGHEQLFNHVHVLSFFFSSKKNDERAEHDTRVDEACTLGISFVYHTLPCAVLNLRFLSPLLR